MHPKLRKPTPEPVSCNWDGLPVEEFYYYDFSVRPRKKYITKSGPPLLPLSVLPPHDENETAFILEKFPVGPKLYYEVGFPDNDFLNTLVSAQNILNWVSSRTLEEWENARYRREEAEMEAKMVPLLEAEEEAKLDKAQKAKEARSTKSKKKKRKLEKGGRIRRADWSALLPRRRGRPPTRGRFLPSLARGRPARLDVATDDEDDDEDSDEGEDDETDSAQPLRRTPQKGRFQPTLSVAHGLADLMIPDSEDDESDTTDEDDLIDGQLLNAGTGQSLNQSSSLSSSPDPITNKWTLPTVHTPFRNTGSSPSGVSRGGKSPYKPTIPSNQKPMPFSVLLQSNQSPTNARLSEASLSHRPNLSQGRNSLAARAALPENLSHRPILPLKRSATPTQGSSKSQKSLNHSSGSIAADHTSFMLDRSPFRKSSETTSKPPQASSSANIAYRKPSDFKKPTPESISSSRRSSLRDRKSTSTEPPRRSSSRQRSQTPLVPIYVADESDEEEEEEADAEPEWELEGILDEETRIEHGKQTRWYLIKWVGDWEDSWEPFANVGTQAIKDWNVSKVSKARKAREERERITALARLERERREAEVEAEVKMESPVSGIGDVEDEDGDVEMADEESDPDTLFVSDRRKQS